MGKGLLDNDGKSFERKTSTHGMPVGEAGGSFEKSLLNLGGDLSDPFRIFDEVKVHYEKVLKKNAEAAEWKKKKRMGIRKSEADRKLQLFFSGNIPDIDFSQSSRKRISYKGSISRCAGCTGKKG